MHVECGKQSLIRSLLKKALDWLLGQQNASRIESAKIDMSMARRRLKSARSLSGASAHHGQHGHSENVKSSQTGVT